MSQSKVPKKTDYDLWSLIANKIAGVHYIFLNHAKERLIDRKITDVQVLNILEHKRKVRRNKSKDTYATGYPDWKYCIEAIELPNIRIIISFDKDFMLVITVIRIDREDRLL